MVLAVVARDDGHVERVRLVHDLIAAEILALRREVDAIDGAAKPREVDRQRHVAGIDGLAAVGGPSMELGLDAALEDRELERELAVFEQTAAVRAPRRLLGVLVAVLVRERLGVP